MASFDTTTSTSFGSVLGAWVSRVLAEYRARRARNAVYNATLAELQALSLRELDDIGISRCDLKRIATEAADGVTPRRMGRV